MQSLTVFTVNSDNPDMVIQDEQKAGGKALGMMLPYFVTILLFAGAMGLGTDMVAGEKERGTMASMLVAPIKRSSIVLGFLREQWDWEPIWWQEKKSAVPWQVCW